MAKRIDPNLLLIGGAVGLGALFLLQQKNKVGETIDNVNRAVGGVATGVSGIGQGVGDAFIGAGSGLRSATEGLGSGLNVIFEETGETFKAGADVVQEGLNKVGDVVTDPQGFFTAAPAADLAKSSLLGSSLPGESVIDTALRKGANLAKSSVLGFPVNIALGATKGLYEQISGKIAALRQQGNVQQTSSSSQLFTPAPAADLKKEIRSSKAATEINFTPVTSKKSLGGGSSRGFSVKAYAPERDAEGKTKIDRIIEKNKRLRGY